VPKGFISYSHQDAAFVSQLEANLLAAQFDTWRDVHSLRAGDRWPRKLGDAIAASPTFILIWSATAQSSNFVELEWTIAIALKRTICIIALDASDVPPSLRPYQSKRTLAPNEASAWLLNQPAAAARPPVIDAVANPILQNLSAADDTTRPQQIIINLPALASFAQAASNIHGNVIQSSGPVTIIQTYSEPNTPSPSTVPNANRNLRGKVLLATRENTPEPVPNAQVTLEQTGESATSNSAGLFSLPLPPSFMEGEEISINISVPGFAIFHPMGGRIRIPRSADKEVIPFKLLPLSSPRFFSHEHLVALLESVAAKSAKDIRPSDSAEKQPNPDLSRYLEEWAQQYGFKIEQVKAEVDRWAASVEEKHDNSHELGLAAFAKRNFAEAATRFLESARQNELKLQETRTREQQLTADTIRDYRLAADSYSNNYDFATATEFYEKALFLSDRRIDPQLWASACISCGNARWNLGIRTLAADAVPNLLKARGRYEEALEVYTREQLPQDWAATQNNLGNALSDLAGRSEGAAAVQALNDAVSAYRRALEVRTREQLPQDWAMTQNNLGTALRDLAERSEGAAAVQALNEAVSAYRRALEVYTREQLPQDWAMTQNNLGLALWTLAGRSEGAAAVQALNDAISAFPYALEVRTREQLPQAWALTQNNLGVALWTLAERSEGAAALQALKDAVSACRSALDVRTREQLPQDWATTQNNLGNALSDLAGRSEGAAALQALNDAVTAYRRALEVYTREQLPQGWAMTHNNLGNALRDLAGRTEGAGAVQALNDAVSAYRSALEVRTREQLPQAWAATQNNLGSALWTLAGRSEGAAAVQALNEAVSAYRRALEVYTENEMPFYWVLATENLALAYEQQKDWPKALETYQQLLRHDPQNATYRSKVDELTQKRN